MTAPTTWDEAARAALDEILSLNFGSGTPSLVEELRADVRYLRDGFGAGGRSSLGAFNLIAWDALDLTHQRTGLDEYEVAERVHAILVSKQHDYGCGNILAFGVDGLIVRLSDKVARLINLLESRAEPKNESVLDTLFDIIGYAAIAHMLKAGTFELPLAQR